MLKFNLIMVPTDFSDYSLRALPYAVGLAERFDARVQIVYVCEPSLQVSDIAWIGVDERVVDESHTERARTSIHNLIADRVPDTVEATGHVLSGDPVEAIVGFAHEHGADLIVMATHGRGGLSHMLMGSVAEQIVRKASCPVLTLKQPMTVTAV